MPRTRFLGLRPPLWADDVMLTWAELPSVLADEATGDGGGGDLGGHAAGPLRLQRVRLPASLRLFSSFGILSVGIPSSFW